ncbi:MAG: adenylyltransferase/cytidyltransferase family protein [Candidatus Pacebacteria bacterium]|nr:adenylyltransferase/cytidyltransferase family protein [Candidatus Paceibacterota bacterium]
MKKILVFGTFDILHDGHMFLFEFARKQGDRLVASIAHDEVVFRLKKHVPKNTMHSRAALLEENGLVDEAHVGDSELGIWSILHTYHPDLIVVGYDQDALYEALDTYKNTTRLGFSIIRAPAYKGERLHSSLLQENNDTVQ